MNFKRKKNRKKVRCSICTPYRHGNSKTDQEIQNKRADVTATEFVEDVLMRVR